MQLTHYTSKFKPQTFPIVVVADNVTNASNIGSLFRICDAFGVEKLVLCGENIELNRKTKKTSRATENVVPFNIEPTAKNSIEKLKHNGYFILALEISTTSKAIHTFSFLKHQPIALIVGDENFGISNTILKLANTVVHIDMFGQNSSMNVAQATNIALYEITKQLR